MHRAIPVIATALILGQPALALAQAQELTIFGPKQYDHPDAGTSRGGDTIAVPGDASGPFTLRIQNGDAETRVDAGWVFVNGIQIVGPADLHPRVRTLERPVSLRGGDELAVVVRGRAGTRLTLSISGRLIPPVPIGLAPDPVTIIAGATADVVATLSHAPRTPGMLSVVSADAGVASVPASVAFAAGQAQVPIPVTGVSTGSTTLKASLNDVSVISQVHVVLSLAPANGAVGTLVTLSGTPFDPVPANNQVSFSGPGGVPAPAAVIAANTSQLTVRVPALAASGPIAVTNSRGTAQSAPFTLTAQSPHLGPAGAGITALSGVSGSPVTPFVQGADPWDAFGFLVLAQPANGTASIDRNNKLVYTSNPGFSGLDPFPIRVLASDRLPLEGTARVRVYTADDLGTADIRGRCKSRSVPDATRTPPLVRNNVSQCATYGEVVTRTTAAGDPITVKYVAARPSDGAPAKAAVFLIGGADLAMGLSGDAVTGEVTAAGGNFLVRSAQLFADAGYLAIAMDRPSDQPSGTFGDAIANIDQYRISVDHAVDILAVLRETNTDNLDVFLSGISRGALSAVASNLIAAGISLPSPVTRASLSFPDRLFINDPTHPNLLPSFVKRPAEILRNTSDAPPAGCPVARPADSLTLANNLQALGIPTTLDSISGGFAVDPEPCDGLTLHAFLGIEPGSVTRITNWLATRVTALAGNVRPQAAFAALATASATSLAIDLGTLARGTDGDTLSYTLSHVGSSRGGIVTLNSATATYTPPAGAANVTDYFVYVVTDGRGGVSAAVITIKIGD